MTSRSRCFAVVITTSMYLLTGCGGGSSSGGSTATATASTTTSLVLTANPAPEGAPVILYATVSANTSAPTGTVTFLDGATSLGAVTLSAIGTASLTVTTFVAGSSHTLSVTYPGAPGFAASTSPSIALSINSVSAPTTINAHAAFTFTTPNQTISGFGAAEAFDLTYLDQHPNQAAIYKALFDPTSGLGLTYLRIQDLYSISSAAGFDPDTPAIVKAATAAHGAPLTLLMSSWSPPYNLKSNGSTVGCITSGTTCVGGVGTLIQVNGAYDYADFATYWLNSLNAYATLGVVPTYISIQNEPDFTATYTGCRFNPTEATYNGTNYASYTSAFAAVYQKLATMSSPPKMVGPETLSAAQTFLDTAAQIPATQISVYAHHLYNVGSTSTNPDANVTPLTTLNTTYPTQTKFMTEYYASPGFNTAWNIHNALSFANDNAYIFWQATWPSPFSTTTGQATDQQGLIYVDNPSTPSTWSVPATGWTYNDAYYSLKHYSYFVRPGYVRYNATIDNTDERVSVYQGTNPNTGKQATVIVVLNVSTTTTDGLSLNLSNITYANSTVYRSSFATAIATGERFTNLGSYNPAGINLPPQSVVTIVLSN